MHNRFHISILPEASWLQQFGLQRSDDVLGVSELLDKYTNSSTDSCSREDVGKGNLDSDHTRLELGTMQKAICRKAAGAISYDCSSQTDGSREGKSFAPCKPTAILCAAYE